MYSEQDCEICGKTMQNSVRLSQHMYKNHGGKWTKPGSVSQQSASAPVKSAVARLRKRTASPAPTRNVPPRRVNFPKRNSPFDPAPVDKRDSPPELDMDSEENLHPVFPEEIVDTEADKVKKPEDSQKMEKQWEKVKVTK